MVVSYGVPGWTTGGFTRVSGVDDLGLEGVETGMLQLLLPGIVQTTSNAGYYAFYPYLLARWQDMGESIDSSDFEPWYRRQEVTFVAACALDKHRDDLRSVVGVNSVGNAVRDAQDNLDIGRPASEGPSGYLQDGYGGFGMYYRAAMRDPRLTVEGKANLVDRTTELGRDIAEAFAAGFESSTFHRKYREADSVPLEVLTELGDRVCLCSVPSRPEHPYLFDSFFGSPDKNPRWEDRRQTRVASLSLFREFHDQRPNDVNGDLGAPKRGDWLMRGVESKSASLRLRWTSQRSPENKGFWPWALQGSNL